MEKVVPISSRFQEPRANDPARAELIASTVRTLIGELPRAEQERILGELTKKLRPIETPRAGDVLGAIVEFLPKRREWSVEDVKQEVEARRGGTSAKEIYNALSYLSRSGKIARVGYGRYIVEGVEVVTSDDFGGQTTRHEDAYRTDDGGEFQE
jgi:hypothetical protein